MSVVRRPAYVTHSCPEPGSNDFWDSIVPSRETIAKSEAARQFLENHFQTILDDTHAAKQRYKLFCETVDKYDLLPQDKEKLFEKFANEETAIRRMSRTKITTSKFQKIRLIGRGGFGEVWLVRDKITNELYALKVLRKADIIMQDQIANVRTERDILSFSDNPWICSLKCSFQDSEHLYLLLEYMCGGDLMDALIKKGRFEEKVTMFFCAEIALALNSIHSCNYLHRDLKPDNILIGKDGHIKLTDFGLSTRYKKEDPTFQQILEEIQELIVEHANIGKMHAVTHHERGTALGTCTYTAPEILKGQEPTPESDFWSLGVIMYEMLFGCPPFEGRSTQETALRIIHWQRALRFPSSVHVSPDALDVIRHLLCEPDSRYTFEQIKSHPFFADFNFDNVLSNAPPMVPIIKYPTDTTHFQEFSDPGDEGKEFELPNDLAKFAFLGFTFKKRLQNQTLAQLGVTV